MHDVTFIGDAVTAAGFRLAGVHSLAPEAGALAAVVVEARRDCRVLAMTAGVYGALPRSLAEDLAAAEDPLLAILPDARRRVPVADIEGEVRRALGIEV